MSEVYHYSPDLLQLLVDTIEVLCRSKRDVILFFRGAGVHGQVINDLAEQVSGIRIVSRSARLHSRSLCW